MTLTTLVSTAFAEAWALVAPVDSTSGSVNTRRIAASPGVRLRAELVVDGAVVASDSMSP